MVEEKRNSDRFNTRLKVRYGDVTGFISDYAMNISRGGMFISTKEPLQPGTGVSVEFAIPGIRVPIKIQGKVTWVNEPQQSKYSNLIPGMGIEFHSLNTSEQKKINSFIDKLSLKQAE